MVRKCTEMVGLTPKTKSRLDRLGRKGDSYDDIISDLLDNKRKNNA